MKYRCVRSFFIAVALVLALSSFAFALETKGLSLSVSAPKIILEVPENPLPVGDDAAFLVWADGDDLTYQWWSEDGVLADGGNVSGAATDTLMLRSVTCSDNGKRFWCVISNRGGSVTSSTFTLTVNHVFDRDVQSEATLLRKAICTEQGACYYSCICGAVGDRLFFTEILPHHGGTATCKTFADCLDCGTAYGDLAEHTYGAWETDGTSHWKQCGVCQELHVKTEHIPAAEAACLQPQLCEICGYELVPPKGHSFTNYIFNEDATCLEDGSETAVCDDCEAENTRTKLGSRMLHASDGLWYGDSLSHWQVCNGCGVEMNRGDHVADGEPTETEGSYCAVCNRETAAPTGHIHKLTAVDEKSPTCTESGRKAYYTCTCENNFADSNALCSIEDLSALDIPALGHIGGEATCKELAVCIRCSKPYGHRGEHDFSTAKQNADQHWTECVVCGDQKAVEVHYGGVASCEEKAKCADCGSAYGELLPHKYDREVLTEEYRMAKADCTDAASYYYSCICGAKGEECFSYGEPLSHTFDLWHYDERGHYRECTGCGQKEAAEAHQWQRSALSVPYKEISTCLCGAENVVLSHPFRDVTADHWFYEDVLYVYHEGLLRGIEESVFGADVVTSRAMIVTILHRLEGEPNLGCDVFNDVEPTAWYGAAVLWAANVGVVEGYGDGRFGPDDPVTREQIAAILYRYTAYKQYDVAACASLSAFPDENDLSSWAVASLSWAVAEGLINGVSENGTAYLRPGDYALRCQIAAILHRFCSTERSF